ncbi:uncharacterized protein BT62DRAFT_1008064 [Guyanagaster necrorhizus]|uniref:Uncharacterized protein n=1 Tax=Guyanagaster necrorhizus TaxID=856835 RepID=A0A9P7VPB7_9AGAR|nr:uncharacterized protein BT62DRAFT_1008064 [Guyanagaster necrorhizus MCA 3950]KAG7444399.1 hypothetical protein BT62DRAFT_1008064 [Guyanagaster necrorhizus MCA 3950]
MVLEYSEYIFSLVLITFLTIVPSAVSVYIASDAITEDEVASHNPRFSATKSRHNPDSISVDDKTRLGSNRNEQFSLPRAATPDNPATHFLCIPDFDNTTVYESDWLTAAPSTARRLTAFTRQWKKVEEYIKLSRLGKWGTDDRRGPRLDITTRISEDSSCFLGRQALGESRLQVDYVIDPVLQGKN